MSTKLRQKKIKLTLHINPTMLSPNEDINASYQEAGLNKTVTNILGFLNEGITMCLKIN
jgi:hypothetical protein